MQNKSILCKQFQGMCNKHNWTFIFILYGVSYIIKEVVYGVIPVEEVDSGSDLRLRDKSGSERLLLSSLPLRSR